MKKEEIKEQQEETPADNTQSVTPVSDTPQFPVILRGKTHTELTDQLDNLTAPEGATLHAGCIARDYSDGSYILRVDIHY